MSQENVEVVRTGFEAYNRQDAEALAALSTTDVELVAAWVAIEDSTFRGPAAWMSYLTLIRDTWEDWRAEDVEIFDGGEDRVVAVYRVVGAGKTSGARVEHPIG